MSVVKSASAAMLSLVLLVPSLIGQGPAIKLPAEVRGEVGAFVRVPADTPGKEVRWFPADKGLNVFPSDLLKDSRTAVVTAPAAGRFRLIAYTAAGDVPSLPAECIVIVGEAPPVPPGPVPPGPVPPGPVPPVPPTPVPTTGLSVLIVEETGKRSELPAEQLAVLFDKQVRDYLNQKCVADPAVSGWKAFRIYDKDVDLTNDGPLWKTLMGRPRQGVPWVVIASDKGVLHEGALPGNVADTLALLKKYGG